MKKTTKTQTMKDGGKVAQTKRHAAKPTPDGGQQWTRAGTTSQDIKRRAKKEPDAKKRRLLAQAAGTRRGQEFVYRANVRSTDNIEGHYSRGKKPIVLDRKGKPRGGR